MKTKEQIKRRIDELDEEYDNIETMNERSNYLYTVISTLAWVLRDEQ